MNVNQIYELINTVASESIGASAITVTDTSSLVSLGNQIFSSDTDLDAFYAKLPDVIGRVWVKYMEITRNKRGIQRKPIEFGIILEKISTYRIAQAENNETWVKQANPYAPEKMEDKTNFSVNLFSKIATFSIDKVIYEHQLKSAFQSAEKMGAFIELIFADMRNGMIKALNNTDRLCESTAIAQSLTSTNLTHRNLLKEYNTLTNAGLTISNCRRDKDFILWCVKTIKETIARAKELSVLYTVNGAERELDDNSLRLHVLSDFASDMMIYAQSSTYHKELVELYGYEEVPMWQAMGTTASFEEMSKIAIENGEGINIEQSGIICHLYHYDRMGSMIDRIRTKSDYIPTAERTLYSHKAEIGYFVAPDEIGVVFYIAEDNDDNANYGEEEEV